MHVRQLGESCLIIKELPCPPAQLAHTLNQTPPPGLHEAVPAFDQLALYFDPDIDNLQDVINWLGECAKQLPPQAWGGIKGGVKDMASQTDQRAPSHNEKPHPTTNTQQAARTEGEGGRGPGEGGPAHHTIPALYNGPDLAEAAQPLNLSPNDLIRLHTQATYTVEAIGFCPGFPYLSGLPHELQNLPRRSTPRTQVEPGTIAITGDQCCIYPLPRPGGWNLIAQTPLTLVDPESNYFPLQVGDTIQFQPIDQAEFDRLLNSKL